MSQDDVDPKSLVQEYHSLPPSSDHLPDGGPNSRKCEILFELDEYVNTPEVSQLLVEILDDPREFDLARVEAIKLVGIYLSHENPHFAKLRDLILTIAAQNDDEMLQGWAQRYVDILPPES